MRSITWSSGSPLSGSMQNSSDIDFYIDGDMVHVVELRAPRQYGEAFVQRVIHMGEVFESFRRG